MVVKLLVMHRQERSVGEPAPEVQLDSDTVFAAPSPKRERAPSAVTSAQRLPEDRESQRVSS